MPLIDTHVLPIRDVKPGWHGRFFEAQEMSFVHYTIDAGATLHEHSHSHEEVWTVISGDLEITIGAETFRAGAGAVAIVPPNTAHSVRTFQKTVAIIVDHPVRKAVGSTGRAAFQLELEAKVGTDALDGPIAYRIHNVGREPGVLLSVEIESAIAPSLPPPVGTVLPNGALGSRVEIAGGASLDVPLEQTPFSAEERDVVSTGRGVLFVRGVIIYEDAGGEPHHSTFCRVFERERGFVSPPKPGYNYGD